MRGEGRGRAGAGAGAGAQRRPSCVAGVAARGARTRARSAVRRPNFCLRPQGRRWRVRAVRPRVTSSHVNGFLLCCRRGGGRGTGGSVSARGGARARFLPPAPSTSCRLHSKEKGRRKSWAATQVRVGDGRAGAGRLSRGGGGGGGSGTAATPASRPRPPLRTDHAALAGSGGRTGANKVRPSWRGGAGPRGDGHRARWVCGEESARGAAWGEGGANTRRWGRPEPGLCRPRAWSCEPGAGVPGAPRRLPSARGGEERERGRGERGEARRGGDPTLPSWPGQRRRRLHNSDFKPPEATRLTHPRTLRGSAPGGGVTRWPPRWPGCALPSRRSAVRSVIGPRWLEAKRSAGRGRRAAGTRCLFGSHRELGSPGVRGARAPGGLRCGAAASARGERGTGEGGGRRIPGGGVVREAPGKEPPAPSSHHYRAAFLRMAQPRGAPRRGSAPQTPGRPPAL